MMTKQLGQTTVHIPEVGLGTWAYNSGVAPLHVGFDAGALFVDTGESYGAARELRYLETVICQGQIRYASAATHPRIVWIAATPGFSTLRIMVSSWNQRS